MKKARLQQLARQVTARARHHLATLTRPVTERVRRHRWATVFSSGSQRWLAWRQSRAACILGILLLTGAARGVWFVGAVVGQLPASAEIGTLGVMANATVIYDAFDQPVFTLFRERRLSMPLENISPHLIKAVIAVEDHRFYRHRGFDLIRIGGAAFADVTAGRLAQGGSTITQQLARVSLLSRERTFRRKLAEVITAVRIERTYSKERILELYLNKVYFGEGFYGAEAAALGYFGKRAAELTLGEAALLAGLIRAPARYSPADRPEEALERRDVVLAAMVDTRVVGDEDVDRATQESIRFQNSLEAPPDFGGYFKEEVRRRLVDGFGADAVYQDGLHVYTTLVPDLQRAAEAATTNGLHRIETQPRFPARETGDGPSAPHRLQAALLALDPQTGAVRAIVGGRSFAESPFNRATQARRQPGSAFKPFLYAAAIDMGITPVTRLTDLDRPTRTAQGEWLPDDSTTASVLTVRAALRLSSNRAAVRLLELTGIERTVDYADRFALGPQPRVPSVALGSGTVTLEALTAAYATFANQGVVPRPTYIRRVERDDGEVVFNVDVDEAAAGTQAVKPATAFIVANLLRDVVDAGTGNRVRREGFAAPAAGKTGTTDEYKDAWFVGFTPELVAGVWIGFDQPEMIMPSGYASDLAAPVWAQFMTAAVTDEPGQWLEQPADVVAVEVCALSGALARDACRRTRRSDLAVTGSRRPTYVEYFVRGTAPLADCPLHTGRNPLGFFARLFGRGEGRERPEPPPDATRGEAVSPGRGYAVVHDHVFGSCRGRLIADGHSVRFETTHKDAFTVAYRDLDQFELDAATDTLRVRPRGGRRYNFTDAVNAPGTLSAFHAEVAGARARTAVGTP